MKRLVFKKPLRGREGKYFWDRDSSETVLKVLLRIVVETVSGVTVMESF